MRGLRGVGLLSVVLLIGAAGCGTFKETIKTINQDSAHAPENKAYYAQRLIETVGGKLSDAVMNLSTPKEIADGIKLALPAVLRASDELVKARERYVLQKAEVEAIKAQGLDPTQEGLRTLKLYLDNMNKAVAEADRQRSTASGKFGAYVSVNLKSLHETIGWQIASAVV